MEELAAQLHRGILGQNGLLAMATRTHFALGLFQSVWIGLVLGFEEEFDLEGRLEMLTGGVLASLLQIALAKTKVVALDVGGVEPKVEHLALEVLVVEFDLDVVGQNHAAVKIHHLIAPLAFDRVRVIDGVVALGNREPRFTTALLKYRNSVHANAL